MEGGQGADERNQGMSRSWVGELCVMNRDGSWRVGAQIVKAGSKLHKVWKGHKLGWNFPEIRGGFWPKGPVFS